jgi:xylose isomerase
MPEDLFISHIAGMDTFAIGWKLAHKIVQDKVLDEATAHRYSSYTEGIGKGIVSGSENFKTLEEYIIDRKEIANVSGEQERLEALINQYILNYAS